MSMEPLNVLLGHWDIVGRSLGADHDDVHGYLVARSRLGGELLQLTTTMSAGPIEVESLELVWADPESDGFAAHVYSGTGSPIDYRWERQGSVLVHAGNGATYTGIIGGDGATIAGSWRPDPGQPVHPGSAYGATMHRLEPGRQAGGAGR